MYKISTAHSGNFNCTYVFSTAHFVSGCTLGKALSIEALEFWEGDYSRDAKDCAETSHGKINSFGRGNEVNSKKYKNKVYGRTGKKLDGNALAEAKSQRRNDVRRADRNPAATR
jgi:hypothetical protein